MKTQNKLEAEFQKAFEQHQHSTTKPRRSHTKPTSGFSWKENGPEGTTAGSKSSNRS